jgi:SAM-dependent methyltransferase
MERSLWRRAESRLRREYRRLFPTAEERRHGLVGPPSVWKEKRDFQISFVRSQGLRRTDQFLDIGCGTLRGGIPIIDYLTTGRYTGIDVRTEVENEAHDELRKHDLTGKHPELYFGVDPVDLNLARKFDFAWAHAVLFHLTDERLAECLAFVKRHLEPSGVFYANANVGEHAPDSWREFPVVWRSLDAYRTAAASAGLSVEDLGTIASLGYTLLGANQHMFKFRHST